MCRERRRRDKKFRREEGQIVKGIFHGEKRGEIVDLILPPLSPEELRDVRCFFYKLFQGGCAMKWTTKLSTRNNVDLMEKKKKTRDR